MRRSLGAVVVAALALGACLEPGRPHLAHLDTAAPRLLETTPAADGLLDQVGTLRVTFSERMDPRSLVAGIWLLGPSGERLPVGIEIPPESELPLAVQQQDVPYTVRVTWETPLQPNATFTLVLDTVLTDSEGNRLEGPDGGVGDLRLRYRTP